MEKLLGKAAYKAASKQTHEKLAPLKTALMDSKALKQMEQLAREVLLEQSNLKLIRADNLDVDRYILGFEDEITGLRISVSFGKKDLDAYQPPELKNCKNLW